jgi:aldose 1-epimerase
MTHMPRFSAAVEKNRDLESVVLRHDGGGGHRRGMEARIVPSCGSNLCRFSLGGLHIIDFEPEILLAGGYTGTPVLYPTPNRVRDCAFDWKGRTFRQVKAGKTVSEHGLVHDEQWDRGEPVAGKGFALAETWLVFEEGSPMFEAFPFAHRLGLEFRLTARGLTVTYTIRNEGDREIPFGFGLHPYFMKLSGEDRTFVSLTAPLVMEAPADQLPTGRLLEVDGTGYDLRQPRAVGSLDLDHVYTAIPPGERAVIRYGTHGLELSLEASEDFTHVVVYTPRGERYFCVENQTCSTDAHNLHARGFIRESGLRTVAPGTACTGSVTYAVHMHEGGLDAD